MARPKMTVLGSVFLGDAHHHRVFSTTPPTSPPPSSTSPSFGVGAQQARADSAPAMNEPQLGIETSSPAEISPEVTLELRIRWLEALLLGVRQDATREARKHAVEGKTKKEDGKMSESLFRRAEDVQRKLDEIVAGNDGLKRFMGHCAWFPPCINVYGHPCFY